MSEGTSSKTTNTAAAGNGKSQHDYYNSGSTEAVEDTALVIKRLEAVSFSAFLSQEDAIKF